MLFFYSNFENKFYNKINLGEKNKKKFGDKNIIISYIVKIFIYKKVVIGGFRMLLRSNLIKTHIAEFIVATLVFSHKIIRTRPL